MREYTDYIRIKLKKGDRAKIREKMEETGIENMSAFVRKMAIDGYVIRLDLTDVKEVARLMRINANNINQCAKRANETGNIYISTFGQEFSDEGWKKLEEKCREWAVKYGDIYIVAGPIFYDGVKRSFGRNKIGIPEAFFKVVLCLNGKPRALGFIYANDGESKSMNKCVCTVDRVEEITGFDFFPNLPDSIEDVVETMSNLSVW